MSFKENSITGLIPLCTDCGSQLVAFIATTMVECISCNSQFNLQKIKLKKDKNCLRNSQ